LSENKQPKINIGEHLYCISHVSAIEDINEIEVESQAEIK
jgi:hypothetical protein